MSMIVGLKEAPPSVHSLGVCSFEINVDTTVMAECNAEALSSQPEVECRMNVIFVFNQRNPSHE